MTKFAILDDLPINDSIRFRNLEQLQRYLEVTDEQVFGTAASLAMLSPGARSGVELDTNQKLEIEAHYPIKGKLP